MITFTKFEQSAFLLHSSETNQTFGFDFGTFSQEQTDTLPPIKGLFISHIHGDHYLLENIKAINPEKIFAAVEVQQELANVGLNSTKVVHQDQIGFGAVEIEAFEVNHGPISRPISNLGFHIQLEGKHILFCGDMKVPGTVPDLIYDLVLIPVCGGPVIFDPTEAISFLRGLQTPKLVIPIHYHGQADPQSGVRFEEIASTEFRIKVLNVAEKLQLS